MFDIKNFNEQRNRISGRTFPLELVGHDMAEISGEQVKMLTGRDISQPDKPMVTVYLRSRREEGDMPQSEIEHFITDYLGEALAGGNRDEIEQVMNSPVLNQYTEPGGILLIENAYPDRGDMLGAFWIRRLSRTAEQNSVEAPVWARINNPYYIYGNRLIASLDVIYPEKAESCQSMEELNHRAADLIAAEKRGQGMAVIVILDNGTGEISANMALAGRIRTENSEYGWEDSKAVMEKFWQRFGDFTDSLNLHINEGRITAHVYPGVRYYYQAKGLEAVISRGDRHARAFVRGAEETNGFRRCTVVTRKMEDGGHIPISHACYPLLQDEAPVSLAAVPLTR